MHCLVEHFFSPVRLFCMFVQKTYNSPNVRYLVSRNYLSVDDFFFDLAVPERAVTEPGLRASNDCPNYAVARG